MRTLLASLAVVVTASIVAADPDAGVPDAPSSEPAPSDAGVADAAVDAPIDAAIDAPVIAPVDAAPAPVIVKPAEPPPVRNPDPPVVVKPAPAGQPSQFDGGYTDEEETVETRFVAPDPYADRPAISAAFGLGFGAGWVQEQLDGVMLGSAALRVHFVRAKAELSGGTGLSHLDVAVGGDIGLGNRRFHGLAARAGYSRGFRIREDMAFHELRADIGLASLEGFSWLSGRLRVDDTRGANSFFLVVEIERVR